jgi:hypothetical protein
MDATTCSCRSPPCPMSGHVAPRAQVQRPDGQRQGPRFRCARCGGLVSATTGTAYAGRRTDLTPSLRGATALAAGWRSRAPGRLGGVDKATANHGRPVLGHPTSLANLAEVSGAAWGWSALSPVYTRGLAWVGGKRPLRHARRRLCRRQSATAGPIPCCPRDARPHSADALLEVYDVWGTPPRQGTRGRLPTPRHDPPPALCYAIVSKERAHGRVVHVTTRLVYGPTVQGEAALRASPGSHTINT